MSTKSKAGGFGQALRLMDIESPLLETVLKAHLGPDLRSIQLLLGHADLKTTQRYLNVTDAELLAVMNEKLWKEDRPAGPPDCQQVGLKVVAGARNQHYLQRWRPAA